MSLWEATAGPAVARRSRPLPAEVDVAIIGAGYTGLWTALEVARRRPDARVVVIEREHVGFGASGRNGGWCSALFPVGIDTLIARHGRPAALALQRALFDAVAEVGTCAAEWATEGIDVGWASGGTITIARNASQVVALQAEADSAADAGIDPTDIGWRSSADVDALLRVTDNRGGLFSPHCGAVHPLRLVRAVADVAERAGVTICERVAVAEIHPRRIVTDHGTVGTDSVVVAVEAYRAQLPGERRSVLPVYSLMIGSEPIPQASWDEIGLAERTTFADARHTVIYGQRTADDRLAFGGRGAPYHYGSRVDPRFDTHEATRRHLIATVHELFPMLAATEFPFHWGGPLAVPRDWHPFVRYDPTTGIGTAGGYVGDGVAMARLAGTTLADLIVGDDTEHTRLPIVGHHSRRWEPEPLRWLGAHLVALSARRADTGPAADAWSRLFDRLT